MSGTPPDALHPSASGPPSVDRFRSWPVPAGDTDDGSLRNEFYFKDDMILFIVTFFYICK